MSRQNVFDRAGYQRIKRTVPANSIYTIDFNGNHPNFYLVNNMGETSLYFSTMNMPKTDLYDFKAGPNSIATFSEPFVRDKLYVYNPNNVDCDIMLRYWHDDFEPLFSAISNINVNVDGQITTDGVVNAFNVPLPSGTNNIGSVELGEASTTLLNNLKSVLDSIESGVDSLDNLENRNQLLGDIRNIFINLSNIKDDVQCLNNISSNSANISSKITQIKTGIDDLNNKLADVITAINNIETSGGGGGGETIIKLMVEANEIIKVITTNDYVSIGSEENELKLSHMTHQLHLASNVKQLKVPTHSITQSGNVVARKGTTYEKYDATTFFNLCTPLNCNYDDVYLFVNKQYSQIPAITYVPKETKEITLEFKSGLFYGDSVLPGYIGLRPFPIIFAGTTYETYDYSSSHFASALSAINKSNYRFKKVRDCYENLNHNMLMYDKIELYRGLQKIEHTIINGYYVPTDGGGFDTIVYMGTAEQRLGDSVNYDNIASYAHMELVLEVEA